MAAPVLGESDYVRARRFQLASQGIDLDAAFDDLSEELARIIKNHRWHYQHSKEVAEGVAAKRPYLPGIAPPEVALSDLLRTCDNTVRDWDDTGGVRFGVVGSSLDENLHAKFKVKAALHHREFLAEATIVIMDEGESRAVRDVRWAQGDA